MLDKEDSVLVFIDVQGRLAEVMYEREQMGVALERMVRGAHLMELPILLTEQLPGKLGPTNEPFCSLLEGVMPIAKSSFSCWGEPVFEQALRTLGRKQVILVGIESHICVYQTAVDLLANEYEVIVVADAVSSRCPENKALALAEMQDKGAAVLPAESILFALMRDAKDPRFKQLLGLIK